MFWIKKGKDLQRLLISETSKQNILHVSEGRESKEILHARKKG